MPDRTLTIAGRDLSLQVEGRDLALSIGNAPGGPGATGAQGPAGAAGATGAQGPAGPGVETTDVRIHLDAVLGSDLNDGTAGSPVATMAAAGALAPEVSTAAVIYQFDGAGNYAYSECPTVFGATGRWSLYATSGTRVIVATGTAGVGTDSSQVSGTFTTNQHQHRTLEMTSGAASGYRRTVMQCSTTQTIPCRRFETAASTPVVVGAASGDTYSVYRPGVVITGFTGVSGKRVLLWDLAFASVTEAPQIQSCDIWGWGVEFRGTSVFPVFTSCTGSFGVAGGAGVTLRGSLIGVRTFNLPWYADFGQPATATTQAQQKGCGVSFPDVISAGSSRVHFQDCTMACLGTWPGVTSDDGFIALGGYVWGNSSFSPSHVQIIGRANSTALLDSTVFRSQWTALGARVDVDVPVLHQTAAGSAVVLFDDAAVNYASTSAGSVIDAASNNGGGITVDRRSHILIAGSLTYTGNCAAVSASGLAQAVFQIYVGSQIDLRAALVATNAGTRQLLVVGAGATFRSDSTATLSLTGSGGVQIEPGGTFQALGAVTTSGGQIVNNGGTIDLNANVTIGTAPGIPFLSIGGQVTQRAGILSCIASAGDGLRAEAGARVRLRSGTNTVLTGAGAGNVGCRAKAGASVWFDGAPTSVTGPADLQVAGTTYPNTDLGADHTFVTDGSGTTIGRAA